jgi:hypothetical protein
MNAAQIEFRDANWLERFEAVGGFLILDGEAPSIGQMFLGYSETDQREAKLMIDEFMKTRQTQH